MIKKIKKEFHLFATNSKGQRSNVEGYPTMKIAKNSLKNLLNLPKKKRKILDYSNPRIKTIKFKK